MDLADRIAGPVYAPGDAPYVDEVAAFNVAVTHSPELVAGVTSTEDVVAAVRFAGERGHRVTVQATGHTMSAVTAGLLVSTRRLDSVRIDPAERVATVGAGARWGSVVAAAAEHGLAPIAGSSATVGVAGFLLGGGLGPLARSHGFGSDHLVGATVVTGAGEALSVDAEHHPDLLWALRGGKFGLGVVTELRIRLAELATMYAGSLAFAEADADAALRAWAAWTGTADPRVTTSALLIRYPPLDVVPEPLRGRLLLHVRFAFPGPAAAGEALAAPLRAAAPVFLDDLGELPVAQVARIHNDPAQPGPSWVHGLGLSGIDERLAAAVLAEVGPGRDTPFAGVELRHLGEATQRDVPEGSAVGGRSAGGMLGVVGLNPALFETAMPAAAERLDTVVGAWAAEETNINFQGAPITAERVATGWSDGTLARLGEIRRVYDPDRILAY